jgi:hypothetical protein
MGGGYVAAYYDRIPCGDDVEILEVPVWECPPDILKNQSNALAIDGFAKIAGVLREVFNRGAKRLELSTNARQLDEIYTPRNKVTPAALAMVMSAEGASLDHRSAG